MTCSVHVIIRATVKAGTQEWNQEWNRNGMESERNEIPLINNTWATELRRTMEQSAEKDVIVDLTGIAGSSDFIDLTGIAGSSDFIDLTLDCEEKMDTENLQT